MTILADLTAEARRVVEAAAERDLTLRLLGGVAIRIHSPSATHRSLVRSYPDLDFAMAEKRSNVAETLLQELGYAPNKSFNLLNGSHRLLFFDETNNRQVDIFVGGFNMCHRIPFTAERFQREPLTLPLAELLLTKMQIFEMNEKDKRDSCTLLLDHAVDDGDDETINAPYIAGLGADDWGLWKTLTLSIQKVRDFCDSTDLAADQKQLIHERLDALYRAMEEAPKSFKWKARNKVGERVRWYELPEEVQRG
jgi:hypothetical protein